MSPATVKLITRLLDLELHGRIDAAKYLTAEAVFDVQRQVKERQREAERADAEWREHCKAMEASKA